MKKILILFLFFVFYKQCFSLNFNYYINFNVGINSGYVDEIVYENGNRISLLNWKVPVIPSLEIETNFEFFNLNFHVNYKNSIPVKSGNLKDFDYLSDDYDSISHFSEHDLYVDKDFSIDSMLGWKFKLWENINFTPFAGFLYQNRKFTARDGYLQYSADSYWDENEEKTHLLGNLISYEQAIFSPLVGLKISKLFKEKYNIEIDIMYFPYVTAKTLDSHFLRLTQFYDSMQNGDGVRAKIGFSLYSNSKHLYKMIKFIVGYESFVCEGSTSSAKIGADSSGFTIIQNANSGLVSKFFFASVGFSF